MVSIFISFLVSHVALHSMGRFETAQPVNPRFGHCRTTSWRTSRPCSERELLVLGQGWASRDLIFAVESSAHAPRSAHCFFQYRACMQLFLCLVRWKAIHGSNTYEHTAAATLAPSHSLVHACVCASR
ncbi:hypothetical protein CI102_4097 [Trichoderma harzianum]|nr:hypothetical protein CI102_4097 [Trichoderma harzianum]